MPETLRISDWLQKQPTWMKVAAFLVFGAICVTAAFLSLQDYQTSRLGYLLLPSRKLDPETTAALVGLLPQAFQIALAWVAATRRGGRRLVVVLWLLAFVPDYATDLYFKLEGAAWTGDALTDLAIAFVTMAETFLLFTAGSEFMLMFGWANLSPLLVPALGGALGGAWRGLRDLFRAAAEEAARESGALFNLETAPRARRNGHDDDRTPPESIPDAFHRLGR